jgi:hypothetical protein
MTSDDKKEVSNLYVNIKEHFDALWEEREKRYKQHFDMLAEAAERQGKELERRLEGLNQLREEYTSDRSHDQRQFVRQETYDLKMGGIDLFMQESSIKFTLLMSKYDARLTIPTVIAGLALLVAIVGIFFTYHK